MNYKNGFFLIVRCNLHAINVDKMCVRLLKDGDSQAGVLMQQLEEKKREVDDGLYIALFVCVCHRIFRV